MSIALILESVEKIGPARLMGDELKEKSFVSQRTRETLRD